MKNHIKVLCLFLCFYSIFISTSLSKNIVYDWSGLEETISSLQDIITDASYRGDYLVEKSARNFHLALTNLNYFITQQRIKAFSDLSSENQRIISTAKELIQEIKNMSGILQLEDFMAMDIRQILGDIPFVKRDACLRRIDGFSQAFKKEGYYTYGLIGTAFGPELLTEVSIDGQGISPIHTSVPQMYRFNFNLPVNQINDKFEKDKVVRVPIHIISSKIEENSFLKRVFTSEKTITEKVFEYNGHLLLLPVEPIQYELRETYNNSELSQETFWSEEAHVICPPNGKGHDQGINQRICVTIPEGGEMLRDTLKCWVSVPRLTSWSIPPAWREPSYSNEGKTVCREYNHRIHDKKQDIYMKVKYRKRIDVPKEQNVNFLSTSNNRLPYGIYSAQLSDNYLSYSCILKYFNGEKVVLSPAFPSSRKMNCEIREEPRAKRITLVVDTPN